MWGFFTFYMWIGTLTANRAVQAVFLTLWITFVVLAVGEWTGSTVLHHAGGYIGLLTAACAFYLAAAEIINESQGRTVLPIGAPPQRSFVGDDQTATLRSDIRTG